MVFKKMAMIGLPAIALALGASGGAQAANLVLNGGFESYSGGYGGAPSQLGISPTGGYTTLTDWSIGTGTYGFLFAPGSGDTTGSYTPEYGGPVTLWGPNNGSPNGLPATSPAGGNYVALDGEPSLNGTGISQTVSGLTAGQTYVVSFYWAAAQQYGYTGATTEQFQVSLGTSIQDTPIVSLPSEGFSGWMSASFILTADSTSDVLNFLALGTPTTMNLPPFLLLDGVSVQSTVPEPSAVVLFGAGVLGIGGFSLRQRFHKNRKGFKPAAV